MSEHTPTRDLPWLRVRDQFGNELDRHFQDPGVLDGTFEVIEDYPPNQTATARPTKIHTDKAGSPTSAPKGAELDERLEAAGLAEQAKGLRADEKRALLLEHEVTHEPDPSQEG